MALGSTQASRVQAHTARNRSSLAPGEHGVAKRLGCEFQNAACDWDTRVCSSHSSSCRLFTPKALQLRLKLIAEEVSLYLVRGGWSCTRTYVLEDWEGREGKGGVGWSEVGQAALLPGYSFLFLVPFQGGGGVGLQVFSFFLSIIFFIHLHCAFTLSKGLPSFLLQKHFGKHGRYSSTQSRQELCLHKVYEVGTDKINTKHTGTSLVVQWLRIRLTMQGT